MQNRQVMSDRENWAARETVKEYGDIPRGADLSIKCGSLLGTRSARCTEMDTICHTPGTISRSSLYVLGA